MERSGQRNILDFGNNDVAGKRKRMIERKELCRQIPIGKVQCQEGTNIKVFRIHDSKRVHYERKIS